jgi:hypothetical protein
MFRAHLAGAKKRANLVSAKKLFSGAARFRPAHMRRGFVWDLTQVAQLLVDLEISSREDEYADVEPERFYLGVLAVSRGGHGTWLIRDGLQRLTTLTMVLGFARDRLEKAGERSRLNRMLFRQTIGRPPEPRLRLLPEEHAWYSHFILRPGATIELPAVAPIGSPRQLLLAARFMEQTFENYSQDELSRLADFAANHTAFVRTPVETIHDMPTEQQAWGYAPAPGRRYPTPNEDRLHHHHGVAAE